MADSPRDPTMDPNHLYREEIYTDRKVGTLRVMVPVTAAGAADALQPAGGHEPLDGAVDGGGLAADLLGEALLRDRTEPMDDPEHRPVLGPNLG